MSSFENAGEGAYDKPCNGCRKRKVKCDKTRPCSNCSKSKQLCTYELVEPVAGEGPAQDVNVHDRLARLEGLMAAMLINKDDGENISETEDQGDSLPRQHSSRQAAPASAQIRALSKSLTKSPVGHIYFQDGYCAYYDSDFWASLISEVEDPRRLFDTIVPPSEILSWMSDSTIGLGSLQFSTTHLSTFHPTVEESNRLFKFFFDGVHPFLKMFHQTHFGKELNQYRRGVYAFPREFEAWIFSIYALTINSLHSEVVETNFHVSKVELLTRFKQAAQIALTKVDFYRTDKTTALMAVAHYASLLFHQNLYHDAVALLGILFRQGQSFGFHRDPSHFPFNPWVCAIRRRAFNHVACLNAIAVTSYGVESTLPATSDALPPINANDTDWQPNRFAKPGSIPVDAPGFKEMTFVIVHRAIADLTMEIGKLSPDDLKQKESLIRNTELNLYEKYIKYIDRSNPEQIIVAALVETRLESLRLTISHRRCKLASSSTRDAQNYKTFISAIKLLEATSYHILTFESHNWDWVFSTIVPWLPTAILITQIPHQTRPADVERAQKQINAVFNRYELPLTATPMWQLLVKLRCQMDPEWQPQTQYEIVQTTPPAETMTVEKRSEKAVAGDGQRDVGFRSGDDLMVDVEGQMVYTDDLYGNMQDMQDMPWYVDFSLSPPPAFGAKNGIKN